MEVLSKQQMIENLREMLGDLFEQKRLGVPLPRLARAHGYVDGYMRVLLDGGIAAKEELLKIVSAERALSDGPAVCIRDGSSDEAPPVQDAGSGTNSTIAA